jgi:hypothetical protein
MPEPIKAQNAPKMYQPYIKQDIGEESEAKSAAVAFCSEKPEADCQSFLIYLDAYGYKFDPKEIMTQKLDNQAAATLTPIEPAKFKKWEFEFGWIGLALNFNENMHRPAGGSPDYKSDEPLPVLLLPGISVIHRLADTTAAEIGLRPIFNMVPFSLSLEPSLQFKQTIWREIDKGSVERHGRQPDLYDIFDKNRVNLGLGLVALFTLFRDHNDSFVQAPYSSRERVMLGGRISIDIEMDQSNTVSLEFSPLTNMSGQTFFQAGAYYKRYFPHDPKINERPFDDRPSIGNFGFGLPSGVGSLTGVGR